MNAIRFEYPGCLVSLNEIERCHRMRQVRRAKAERKAAYVEALRACGTARPAFPLVVTVTRVGPRALDGHDNLQAGMKATIDGLADYLGIRDDDPRVTWKTEQAKSEKPRQYAVRIEVKPRIDEGATA